MTDFPAKTPVVLTNTGTLLLVVVPLPSCPWVLAPQQTTLPSEVLAQALEPVALEPDVLDEPTDTSVTVLPANTPEVFTNTGTLLFVVVPLPS